MFMPAKKTPKFQVSATLAPRIVIAPEALAKMQLYVDQCNDEIGWLGTADLYADDDGRVIVIEDTFLPKQEVHSTTTELTPEGLEEIAMELLSKPDGDKIWNRMRMWGHSHVNMGTSPSGQDDKQMKEFSNIGHDWFVRLIANKKGDIRVDFYDYKMGITILDLNWETVENHDAMLEQINKQIEGLYEQIEVLEKAASERREGYVNSIKPAIVEEMKAKVKKKTYQRVGFTSGHNAGKHPHTSHHGSEAGFSAYGTARNWQDYYGLYEDDDFLDDDTPPVGSISYNDDVYLSSTTFKSETYNKKKQLTDYFNDADATELARIKDRKELEAFIRDTGYSQTFTQQEAEQIWALAIKYYSKYIGA